MRRTFFLTLTVLALAQPSGATPRLDRCTGNAPNTASCQFTQFNALTAEAQYAAPGSFQFGSYRGTIASHIFDSRDGSDFVRRCDFTGEQMTDLLAFVQGTNCTETGYHAPQPIMNPNNIPGGVAFQEECFSYNFRSTRLGGSGPWECGQLTI